MQYLAICNKRVTRMIVAKLFEIKRKMYGKKKGEKITKKTRMEHNKKRNLSTLKQYFYIAFSNSSR